MVEGLAIVGRGPEPRPGEEVAHRVALSSSDMSLSKTHAQFQIAADGTLVVMDRGSTNGTTLIRQGAARALGARRPAALSTATRSSSATAPWMWFARPDRRKVTAPAETSLS